MKDYKDTLILPSTNFPMRAKLPEKEGARYKVWQEDAYKLLSRKREGASTFTLHDGPPYANGHLHVGHALNKILKDFIVKLHYFNGSQVFYRPGWDCHGLPIEQQVSANFAEKNEKPTTLELRQACRDHAAKFVEIQRDEFLSLGVVGDFDNPYKTMDYKFEADIYKALVEIANKGLLTQRSKPIFWSWAAKSALAEAEVEYKEKKSDSIFVAFSLDPKAVENLGLGSLVTARTPFVPIWTTTPWTLPSNVAIALHPDENYVLLEDGALVSSKRLDSLRARGLVSGAILKSFEAKNLERLEAINPLNGRPSVIILASYVSLEDGTGAVHNAPGHGEDDYFCCLQYGLPVIMPVDEGGLFDETVVKDGLFRPSVAKEFVGMHIFKAQKRILELLENEGALLAHEELIHSYPHCWRTNKPVIFRATKQWFILMDTPFHEGKTLRGVALEALDGIKFYPASGANRLRTMLQNRPDWCLSRQRDWGVPIAFFLDKNTGEPLLDSVVTSHVATLFEKFGCDIWWAKDVASLLPDSFKDKASNYIKNLHILDVWFDSGSTWFAALASAGGEAGLYPSSVYLEGSDQHRGWFQSSLLLSCAINHKAPFESLITHGFTVDEKGEKMAKSRGNVLAPSSIVGREGSEILRLWVALSDYHNDVKISPNILKQVADNYLKLRNTIRFLLANTHGLERLDFENLSPLDGWILHEAKLAFDEIEARFFDYDFSKGFLVLNNFITASLSGIYLDVCKDSLYCDSKTSPKRLAIQTVFALLANRILHLLAPFLTYTIDEALEHAMGVIKGAARNVFELEKLDLPPLPASFFASEFEFLLEARRLFNEKVDALKKDGTLKSSLELEIVICDSSCSDSLGFVLKPGLVEDFLMVSGCRVGEYPKDEIFCLALKGIRLVALRIAKAKCPRCWQFRVEDGDICARCLEVVGGV